MPQNDITSIHGRISSSKMLLLHKKREKGERYQDMKHLRFLLVLALFVVILALQTISTQAFPVTAYGRIYEGIEMASGTATSPRLMRAWATRISLRNPDVAVYASHDNGGNPYETALQTTPDFLADHGLKTAVNTCFFNAGLSPNTDILGLLVSNGVYVSPNDYGLEGELTFDASKVATFVNRNFTPTGVYNGCGTADIILSNGVNIGVVNDAQPRTGLGLSADGKYLIMVVVDGRQPGWSDGATYNDLAQWLLDFGAYTGGNFDGGGSTCMAIYGWWGGPIVNRPCYGYARAVGANLGVGSTALGPAGPASVSWDANRVDVFTRGALNAVHQKIWTSGGGWSGWMEFGQYTNTLVPVAISSRGSNRLDLFAVEPAGAIYWSSWNGTVWSPFWKFQGSNTQLAPASCSWGANRIDLFAVAPGGSMWWYYYNGTSWSAPYNIPGSTNKAMAACSWGTNRVDMFAIDGNGGIWWYVYNGSTWAPSVALGGNTPYAPAACSWGANRVDMFAVDPNGGVWWYVYNGSTWAPSIALGGDSVGNCSASTRGVGTLDVFIRSKNDHLKTNSYNNGAWSGWIDLGAYFD